MPSNVLLYTLAVLGLAQFMAFAQEDTTVSLVIEPFEYQHSGYLWNVSNGLNYMYSTDSLFGDHALQLSVEQQGPDNVEFQGILLDSAHRCSKAESISIWYKTLGELDGSPSLRLSLFSDSECIGTSLNPPVDCVKPDMLVETTIFDFPLGAESLDNWQELKLNDTTLYDFRRIKGFKIEMLNTTALTIAVDQLSCNGDGTMFELLYLDEGISQDTLYAEKTIEIVNYESELSANSTTIALSENGTTYFDYLVEQTESWGGFVLLATGASGAAYYNMSGATHLVLDYRVINSSSTPSTTSMRLILEDISDCGQQCVNGAAGLDDIERWYSFNNILDVEGVGQLILPLKGDTDPGSSFWLTGWVGGVGNSRFDIEYIKGMIIELNLAPSLGIGGHVSGTFELSNVHVTSTSKPGTPFMDGSARCVLDDTISAIASFQGFTRHEFQAQVCCDICANDPDCLYATTTLDGHCFTAPYLSGEAILLTGTELQQKKVQTVWMDDTEKRGDFCTRCDCSQEDQTIDCRGKDLKILPKTFTEPWSPRVLDLRNNDRLAFIGSESFDPTFAANIQELYLDDTVVYIGRSNFDSLTLESLHLKNVNLRNVITEETGEFSDVCCSRGETIQVDTETAFTFCEMQFDTPGADTVYNDFEQYLNAANIEMITTETSEFMSEAAESPEKCAAYCDINKDCLYFSYDGRFKNALHVCYLLADQGTGAETVCCDADHFGDIDQTLPGWVSGWPPQTRHNEYNARVLISNQELEANSNNNFEVEYVLSLGADPLRGSVWVEPQVATTGTENNVNITIMPSRAVLYDTTHSVTIKIIIHDRADNANILIRNNVVSCDQAFTLSDATNEIVVVSLRREVSTQEKATLLYVISGVTCFAILSVLLAWKLAKKTDDTLWKVNREELSFSDPVQVIGSGTFGLVLLAEYRGTSVAVKRVLPCRPTQGAPLNIPDTESSGNQSTGGYPIDIETANKTLAVDMAGEKVAPVSLAKEQSQIGKSPPSLQGKTSNKHDLSSSWKSLLQEFTDEMRYLSKLRHPCITTVMGAVVEPNSEPMLVMEYMEHGSLYDLLHNETMLLEGEMLLPILRDISQGMRFLHSAVPAVIHGDLKAQNILVDSKFRAKVADFGLSDKMSVRSAGTPYWMAPELLRGESRNNTMTDVYSFGIILYEVYSRKDPYDGEDPNEVLRLIIDRNSRKRPPFPKHCPPQVKSLMSECLRDEPARRPTFEELDIRLRREDVETVQPSEGFSAKARSKQISLHDIFPKRVADALIEGRTVEPENRECVTIFFSDIVGFTEISSRLEPRKIANLLDRLYTKFDALSQKHDVFKVETIGDAYMAVTNLVKDQSSDHVKRIASFAVDAVEAANGTMIDLEDESQGVVHIRAGFHCGPIVADVVGTRNPRYCLFGDAVNIASRMESNSKADRIHCSDTAAELLISQNPHFPLKSRGSIPVKGKGILATYWVNES